MSPLKAPAAAGSLPTGAKDERSAARAVQSMFDAIAPRYDLLNHVLSLNIDRLWWWRTARRFRSILRDPNARVVDVMRLGFEVRVVVEREGETTWVQLTHHEARQFDPVIGSQVSLRVR